MRKLWNFFKKLVLVLVAFYLFAVFTDLRILKSTGGFTYSTTKYDTTITEGLRCVYWSIRPFWVSNTTPGYRVYSPHIRLTSFTWDRKTQDEIHYWDSVCPNFYFQPNPLKAGDALLDLHQ